MYIGRVSIGVFDCPFRTAPPSPHQCDHPFLPLIVLPKYGYAQSTAAAAAAAVHSRSRSKVKYFYFAPHQNVHTPTNTHTHTYIYIYTHTHTHTYCASPHLLHFVHTVRVSYYCFDIQCLFPWTALIEWSLWWEMALLLWGRLNFCKCFNASGSEELNKLDLNEITGSWNDI